jgi:hypothetical protein
MTDRRGFSFRDSSITFAFMTVVVTAVAVALLVLLDPRAQAFWGAKFSDLGTGARALVGQLPWMR